MADYPGDWNSRRRDVYQRDDYTCQNCGRTGGQRGNAELHAHHIVPKAKGGTHSKSNLVAVCKQCHNAIHGNSNAPTKGRSYWNELSTILENVGTYAENHAQYMTQLSNFDENPRILLQVEDTERTLRSQIFQIKTQLAEFDADNAPSMATNSFIQDIKTFSKQIYALFETSVDILDVVEELRQEIITDDVLSCPECDASVEPNSSFCSSCGTELPDMLSCPECDADVELNSSFCSSCGTELPDTDDITEDNLSDLVDEYREKVNTARPQAQILQLTMAQITAQTGDMSPSNSTERVGWRYCPNCGFRHSVYKPDGGVTAECFVCKAQWKKSGFIFTKWKMVTGECSGDKKAGSEWKKLGRKKNDNEEYMQYAGEVNSTKVKRKFGE